MANPLRIEQAFNYFQISHSGTDRNRYFFVDSESAQFGDSDNAIDVKFWGATSGAYLLWDCSTDDLKLGGGAGLDLTGTTGLTLSGTQTTALTLSGTNTTGILFSGTHTTGINFGDVCTTAIGIGAATTGVSITGITSNAISLSGATTTSAINITATDTAGTYGIYLKKTVTGFAGSDYVGAYIRAESATNAATAKSLYGTIVYGTANAVTHTTGSLWGNLTYAYVKGDAAQTIANVYGSQIEFSMDAGRSNSLTVTTEAAMLLLKATAGKMADYTKLNGMIIRLGDMDGGSRTFNNGILIEDDSAMGGTCGLTTGIYVSAPATTVLNVQHVGSTGNHVIDMIDAYTGLVIETGSYSSTVDKGITINATNNRPVSFLFDDSESALTGDVRPVLSRVYLGADQTSGATLNAIRGQIKVADDKDLDHANNVFAPVQGYFELAGTANRTITGHAAGVRSAIEEGASGTTTISASSYYAGFEATLNSTRTYTVTGDMAGLIVNISGGTSKWYEGILIDGTAVVKGMRIGKFAGSAATTSAVQFSTAQNVYSDGQLDVLEVHGATTADLTSAYSAKCGRFRHIINTSSGTAAHETYGLIGQVVVKDSTLTHLHAGLMGTFEGHSSGVVVNSSYAYGAAGVLARVGGGDKVTATTDLSGVVAFWNGAALASGESNAFAACDSGTVAWTNLISVSRATNLFDLPAAGTDPVIANALVPAAAPDGGTMGADACLRVLVGGVAYYIPLYDTLHA